MAYGNARTIKEAVDEVIDTIGSDHITEVGVEADEWGPFCDETGLDPDVRPAVYRDIRVRPVPIGGGITVGVRWPF